MRKSISADKNVKSEGQKQTPRALFLDRDGIVNEEIGYLSRSEQVRFVDGIFDLCRRAQTLGYFLVIVTNQAGIARGLYTEEDFHALTEWMTAQFAREGVRIDRTYFCPHHPEHGVGKYRKDCPDRKPNPGMLLQAAQAFHLDLGQSIFLGDRCTDMAAGVAAGVDTLLVLAGMEPASCAQEQHIRRIANVREAMDWLRE